MSNGTEGQQAPSAPEQLAITVGTAVPAATTIDALFTSLFATRSSDLGAASYVWATPNKIVGTFPAGTSPTALNMCKVICTFEANPAYPSKIAL
jgi:hypothetical protein